jgi:Tol biopolymer transport system component
MEKMLRSNFGPYEILGMLGAGGMGEVYRARDPRLQREVALKILGVEGVFNAERQRRFLQEARSASALNHPNILSVFDIGDEDGRQYIVAELVEGESLRGLLQRGPVPVRKLLDIAIQVAAGLTAAHEAGIVHRDLKPENIMLTLDERVKILDFGLAKPRDPVTGSAEEQTRSHLLTTPGMIMGTASYMSPEQARGEELDFRSDQFSFGLILYEMATGKKAFQRDTPVQTLSAIISEDPSPISTHNVKIPAPLRWQIEGCLAKNPRERYGATIDLYHELRNIRDHLSETSYSSEPLVQLRTKTRKKLLLGAAAVAVASLVGGLLLSSWFVRPSPVDLGSEIFTPVAVNEEVENYPAWSRDGKSIAYVGEVNGVLQIFTRPLSSSVPIQLTHLDTDCYRPAWSSDGNRIFFDAKRKDTHIFDIWAVSAAGGSPQIVIENAANPELMPDGKSLFFFRNELKSGADIALWISSPVGSKPRKYPLPSQIRSPLVEADLVIAPDGSKMVLLYSSDFKDLHFWIIPYPKGTPYECKNLSQNHLAGFSWMPDGRHIVFSGDLKKTETDHLWIADTKSESQYPLTGGIEKEMEPAVSPDGKKILFVSSTKQYDLIQVPLDGSPFKNLTLTSRNEKAPAWSPQGDYFAYASDRNGSDVILLRSPSEGWERSVVTQKDFEGSNLISFSRPAFSPDGQRIAYHCNTSERTTIWISNIAGGSPVRLTADRHNQFCPAWSPDGEWLAYIYSDSGKYVLSRARFGASGSSTVIKTDALYFQPQWSPKGNWILYHSNQGLSLVSPDAKGTQLLGKGYWLTAGWSKDGSTIYAIKQDENRRLLLFAIDAENSQQKLIGDLGPSPVLVSDAPFAGFSLSPDGKSFLTSILRMKADLWMLENFMKEEKGFFRR